MMKTAMLMQISMLVVASAFLADLHALFAARSLYPGKCAPWLPAIGCTAQFPQEMYTTVVL